MAESKLEILLLAKDQASDKINTVTSSLGDLGGKVIKGAAVGLGVATAAMGAAGAGAIKLARDAAPIQGVQNAFEGLADAAGYSADVMLKSLADSSAGMVTNADLMQSFNKAAGLVSQDFAEKLPDAMGYLGKVSAATGEDMGFMLDSLVTGVGRLSPMILDNLQIQVSLSEATAKASEMFGVEESQLTKTQQQAGMMEVTLAKLAKNTEAMPDVVGSAEQKFASFGIQLQNTKDAIGLALLPAVTPLMDKLGELASNYLPMVVDAFGPFVEKISELITALLDAGLNSSIFSEALANLVGEDMAGQIMGIVEWITNLATTISDFAQNVLIPFIQDHWEQFKQGLIAVGAILAGAAILSGIMSIIGVITALLNPITLIVLAIGALALAWANNWGGIQEKTAAVLGWLQNAISTVMGWVVDFWAANGEQIMAIAQQAWAAIQSIIQSVLTIISTIVNAVLTFIKQIWDKHGKEITALIQLAWQTIVTIIQSVINIIKNIFAAFAALLKGDWQGLGEALKSIWESLWTAIQAIFTTAKAALTVAFNLLKTILGNIWDRIKTSLTEVWQKAWAAITDYLATAKQNVINKINELIQRVKDAFHIDWAELGRAIIDGIANGISNTAGKIKDAAVNAAKKAWEAAKKFFGISSPSKLFADLGMETMIGFADGIEEKAPMVEWQVISEAENISNAFSNTIIDSATSTGMQLIDSWDATMTDFTSVAAQGMDQVIGTTEDGIGEIDSIWKLGASNLQETAIDWNDNMQSIADGTESNMGIVANAVKESTADVDAAMQESLDNMKAYWENAGSIFGGENPITGFLPDWPSIPGAAEPNPDYNPADDFEGFLPGDPRYRALPEKPPDYEPAPFDPTGQWSDYVRQPAPDRPTVTNINITTSAPINLSERDIEVLKSLSKG